MRLSRPALAILASFAFLAPAAAPAIAQAPATSRTTAAPTMPAPTSPTVPTHIGTPVKPTTPTTAPTATATPTPAPAATASAPMASGKKIDINAASESELAALPGIGPVTAKAIIDGRPWDDLADLTKKKAVNGPTFERNKDRLALANINTSSAADMAKTLPGIGDKTAPKIVNARPYATPDDLVTKKVLTPNQLAKIKNVITY